MRVKPLTFAVSFVLGGIVLALLSSPLHAQRSAGEVSAPAEGDAGQGTEPVIDEVKLIAQRAAMASLTGERPFILRESSWSGMIDPGKARLIQLQLFKRNEYHFWMAVPDRDAGVNVHIYDGNGEIVEGETIRYDVRNVAGLIVRPSESGVYYLRISLQTTVATPQEWAVIYAYR